MNKTDRILLRIGNTILCNYGMNSNPGLMDGRMGVCLFLYEYARYTGMTEYENIVDDMIDLILHSLHKEQSEENICIVAGIGIGVIYLIKHGFLEDSENNDALEDVDKLLYDAILSAEAQSDMLMAASLYFVYRIRNHKANIDSTQCVTLAENIIRLCKEEKTKDRPKAIESYILQNAEQIVRLCKDEKSFLWNESPKSYKDSCKMISEGNVHECLWYNYLLGTSKVINVENVLDIQDLSRNCFYDPNRNVGVLCAAGLILMKRNREQYECR